MFRAEFNAEFQSSYLVKKTAVLLCFLFLVTGNYYEILLKYYIELSC